MEKLFEIRNSKIAAHLYRMEKKGVRYREAKFVVTRGGPGHRFEAVVVASPDKETLVNFLGQKWPGEEVEVVELKQKPLA